MSSKLEIRGTYFIKHIRDGVVIDSFVVHNLLPTAACTAILASAFNASTPAPALYIGLFEGNYTPQASDTAATFPALATESSAYAESTRQTAVFSPASAGSVDNLASESVFTINATKTFYGSFLSTSSGKGSTSGVLMSAAKFPAPRSLEAGDQFSVSYAVSLASA